MIELDSPFALDNQTAYRAWRAAKLTEYPLGVDAVRVDIADPHCLRAAERARLVDLCARTNTVVYRCLTGEPTDKDIPRALAEQLGLTRLDGNLCADHDAMSSITVRPGGTRHEGYIPYTDRPLNWHTDGYYNRPQERIRAMLLHCARAARQGGENAWLDPEIVYILLRDREPAWVEALSRPDAMTIPPNVERGVEIRGARTGPVFYVEPATGTLGMRYTARLRSIEWRDDSATQAAVAYLRDLFSRGSDYIYEYRLQPGEGLISNNALHMRRGFRDDPQARRLIYRGRFYDRVAGTEFNERCAARCLHAVAE